jgi:hypothetical protein
MTPLVGTSIVLHLGRLACAYFQNSGCPSDNLDGFHLYQAEERNRLNVVAFQQLDDQVTTLRLVFTCGAAQLQPTGKVHRSRADVTVLSRYQIAVRECHRGVARQMQF